MKLKKSDKKCCPDGKTQKYWFCSEELSETIKVPNKTGIRTVISVSGGDPPPLLGKIRQGEETGDKNGEWEDVK